MRGQLQHVFWNLFIRNIIEVFIFFADLIRVTQRHPEKPLTARFECADMLARGEDNPPERHHSFLADCFADDRECLLADLAIRNKIVRAV